MRAGDRQGDGRGQRAAAGVLAEIAVEEGATVQVGAVLGRDRGGWRRRNAKPLRRRLPRRRPSPHAGARAGSGAASRLRAAPAAPSANLAASGPAVRKLRRRDGVDASAAIQPHRQGRPHHQGRRADRAASTAGPLRRRPPSRAAPAGPRASAPSARSGCA